MSGSGEQRRAGKIEVARRRAAYGEVTRVRGLDDEDTGRRSRYDANFSVPTVPASIVANWVHGGDDVEASGADGEHSADMIAERPRREPAGWQRSADR
jgi:hypothetical protein